MMRNITKTLTLLAISLAACTAQPGSTSAFQEAEQALRNFTDTVSSGDHSGAAGYIAPDSEFWDLARQNNPSVDPDDLAALLAAACSFQYQCLAIADIASAEQISETEFHFQVQFAKQDGGLFILRPCCGADATEMPPVDTFDVQVFYKQDQYWVENALIYVP